MATIAERIKQLRLEANLYQEELGETIGVQKNTVYRWENGDSLPNEQNCMLLANFFKVPLPYLMGSTDERTQLPLTEEEEEKQDEDQMIMLYRMLSSDMQKMIRTMVNQAYIIDKRRGTLR